MHRRAALVLPLLLVASCAKDFQPLKFNDTVLLVPPEGKAIVYLLRVPHENLTVEVLLNGTRTAVLPKETYTILSLAPGEYELVAKHPNPQVATAPAVLTVASGERRFIYTSVPTTSSLSTTVVPIAGGFVPLFTPVSSAVGGRRWTECAELDAQGLMSISAAVVAESNAP